MLIKREVLEAIKRGEITLQFRRWKRRTVKPGGTLKTRVGLLRIGDITPIRAEDVTDQDARRAGFADVRDFLKWLDTMKPGELDRIEVSYLGEDPRGALRSDADCDDAALADLAGELDAVDARASTGAWTARVMELIAAAPGRPAADLAIELDVEKQALKTRIRKLKELGLTDSLEVGYRLSPRGERVLAYRRGR